jgi:hypothetical protein
VTPSVIDIVGIGKTRQLTTLQAIAISSLQAEHNSNFRNCDWLSSDESILVKLVPASWLPRSISVDADESWGPVSPLHLLRGLERKIE